MSHVYADYSRARIGFLFGLSRGSSAARRRRPAGAVSTPARGAWVPAGTALLAWVAGGGAGGDPGAGPLSHRLAARGAGPTPPAP